MTVPHKINNYPDTTLQQLKEQHDLSVTSYEDSKNNKYFPDNIHLVHPLIIENRNNKSSGIQSSFIYR